MYPEGDIFQNYYRAGESLIDNSPFFDPYCYQKIMEERQNILTGNRVKLITYFGGTRERFFDIRVCCSKYSLFRYDRNIFIDVGMHGIEGAKISNLQGAVLHFKFLQDFAARTKEEVKREVHFKKAVQYKRYQEKIEKLQSFVLCHDNSLKFQGSKQMLEKRIMKATSEYEQYVKFHS